MTPELEQWLRKNGRAYGYDTSGVDAPATLAGIGPGGWDRNALANAQGQHNARNPLFTTKTVYRLYTEDVLLQPARDAIIGRYFDGATVYQGTGLDARTQADSEHALIVEIVTSADDALQRIADLAGDLRIAGKQISVLVTRQTVDTFEVTA